MFEWLRKKTIKASSDNSARSGYRAVLHAAIAYMVIGQLADKPTRGLSSRGLVNSRTSQLAEMFHL